MTQPDMIDAVDLVHARHTMTSTLGGTYIRTACGLSADRRLGEAAPFEVGLDERVTCEACLQTLKAAGIHGGERPRREMDE